MAELLTTTQLNADNHLLLVSYLACIFFLADVDMSRINHCFVCLMN